MGGLISRIERLIDNAPLKPMHYRIWILSALGIFIDGLNLFIIAVALPLINNQFQPSKWELGLIGAGAPAGAILGAIFLGYLTDKFGRKKLNIANMFLFVIFSFLCAIAWNARWLIIFRFFLGIGVGADYPISSTYLSEFIPKKLRSRAIMSAFSFQAFGALGGAVLGLIVLIFYPHPDAWRWMLGLTIIPAILILFLRFSLPESALWLHEKGKYKKSARILARLTGKPIAKIIRMIHKDSLIKETIRPRKASYSELFSKKLARQTMLTSIPWFLMGICLYGVSIFSAIILAMVFSHIASPNDTLAQNFILSDIRATTGSVFLDLFLVAGFLSAVFWIKKIGTIKLQCLGFLGMTVGLLILGISTYLHFKELWVFTGFAIFNLMVNFGPNPTTYLLPTERFPPYIRASGHGFAASTGKIGAALGIILLPVLIKNIGTAFSMFILAGCSLLGFIFTVFLSKNHAHAGSHAPHDRTRSPQPPL